MSKEEFSHWDNVKILSLLERVEQEEYGLIVELTKPEDKDRLKRKVWALAKERGIPAPNMRTNPEKQLQIYFLRIRKDDGEGEKQPDKTHSPVDEGKPEKAG